MNSSKSPFSQPDKPQVLGFTLCLMSFFASGLLGLPLMFLHLGKIVKLFVCDSVVISHHYYSSIMFEETITTFHFGFILLSYGIMAIFGSVYSHFYKQNHGDDDYYTV